ncbi:MAG: zinc ribbon domain-containing protein [Firmicutes bacterium]|nr:zinc ribbon domain-containing protein [Bacillota bacterium]
MPTYEFLCKKCGKEFTVRTSISRRKEVKCTHCSSTDLQQKFRGTFFFAGSKGGCQTPARGGFK